MTDCGLWTDCGTTPSCKSTVLWICITWAWPFCRPFDRLNRTFTWNWIFFFGCYQQTCHCSWMISYVKYITYNPGWNSAFKVLAIAFKLPLQTQQKNCFKTPPLLSFQSLVVLCKEYWMKIYTSHRMVLNCYLKNWVILFRTSLGVINNWW